MLRDRGKTMFDATDLSALDPKPSNISVLSEESLFARIYGLMTVLRGITEIEMMCLNSRENFEDNKRYLKKRVEEETNPVVRKLLEKDANYLDRMQVQMATAREFLLIIRFHNQKENEIFSYLNGIELAAWTHAEFIRIHLFLDGNDRTSRLLMNYQLLKNGFLPVSVAKEDRLAYYNALDKYAAEGDLQPFMELVATLEEKQLDKYLSHVQEQEMKPPVQTM